ncbi:MAG: flagellar motor switch protein FliM [Geminicoccaceae bacterium]
MVPGDGEEDEVDQDAMAAEWAAMAGGDDDEDEAVDQDAMAAEWAAAAGGEEGDDDELASSWAAELGSDDLGAANGDVAAVEEPTGRELNQNEIDSLLGFDDETATTERSGILAIINSNDISYERLPMLEVVFDRLERMLTTSVRNFTSENVDINLENITAQRFGDYLNSVPLPAMISVFKAVEWDNYGLITVDSPMIYSIVDVLLGGRRGTIPMRVEGRPYTTIEASLVERLIRLVLADLSTAFAPITPVQFRFDRMETNPRFAAIARPGNACVVFKLRIDVQDRGGCIEFLIPYATLEPARDLLLQMFMGEKFGRDLDLGKPSRSRDSVTEVDLEAVLDEQLVSLHDVTRWKVGDDPAAEQPGQQAVWWCVAAMSPC